MKFPIILSLIVGGLFAGDLDFHVKGQIRLEHGTCNQAVVMVFDTLNPRKEPQVFPLGPDGQFNLILDANKTQRLIFAHPYVHPEPLSFEGNPGDTLHFDVTLGSYTRPKIEKYSIVHEGMPWDWKQAIPMEKKGDFWEINFPYDAETLKYQVALGEEVATNGNDPAVEPDNWGDFRSEAKVVDGEVHIRFDPASMNFRDQLIEHPFSNHSGAEFVLARFQARRIYRSNYKKFDEKFKKKDFTATGIEDLISEIVTLRDGLKNPQDILAFNLDMDRTLGRFTPAFKVEDATAWKDDPKTFNRLPAQSIINLFLRSHKKALNPDLTPLEDYLEAEHPLHRKLEILMFLCSMDNLEKAKLETYQKRILDWAPKSHYARYIKDQIKQNAMLGTPAPQDVFYNLEGNEVTLSAFKGKYLIVDLWATWCGPCVGAFPHMKEFYKKLDPQKAELIGINLDVKGDRLKAFAVKQKLPWPQYYSPGNFKAPLCRAFNVAGIPAVFLIDPQGKIVLKVKSWQEPELLNLLSEETGG